MERTWQEEFMSAPFGFHWGDSKTKGRGGMESCEGSLAYMSGCCARKTQRAGWEELGIHGHLSIYGPDSLYLVSVLWGVSL